MTVQTVTLTGSALYGVAPHLISPHLLTAARASTPQQVKLGRRRPRALPMAPRLSSYFSPQRMLAPPPAATNWREKAAPSISRMYLNDTYGDCVIAGKAHALGLWSSNDPDHTPAGMVLATDQEILSQYQGICGPGDNGCVITDVLDVMRSKGFMAGGTYYKIDGYVAIDWTNKLEVQVSVVVLPGSSIGINLPQDWTSNSVWDVTTSPVVGGHDVTVLDYDSQGVYIASWGRVYLITWAAFTSKKWLEEHWVVLAPLWYGNDKLAPNGIDASTLKADLDKFSRGEIPDIGPTPTPPPNPTPPPPAPSPAHKFYLTFDRNVPAGGKVAAFRTPVALPAGKYDVSGPVAQQAIPDSTDEEYGVEVEVT